MTTPTHWTVGLRAKVLLSTLFALAAWTYPLEAQTPWEQDDQRLISMYLPFFPGGPTLLTVNCAWDHQSCVETRAFLTTTDAAKTTQREIPATMIANPSATRAVVQFDDGSLITFEAIAGQHDRIVDVVTTPTRIIYQSTQNYASAYGTLLGQPFDTRGSAECLPCIAIVSIVLRWQP
jgi:hypothetical protein